MCRYDWFGAHGEPGHHIEHYGHCFKPWKFGYMPLRGLLHLLVLKILSKEPMRGIDVRSKLKEELGLDIPASAVYIILGMLENKGLVTSSWEVGEKKAARKIYRITEEGLEYLNEAVSRIKDYKKIFDYLLS